ncbi:CIR protein PIR protein, fragment [Plasmodium vinckei]|uniref:CIR protein PIR protein n=1 Tax=Plasmodium vinckei TaxID=5860 RepID=A0A6V7SFJ1_PLAVN|nr:CIR protein PIR protein, fragment [Plasmodium vinckei]
MFDHLRKRSPDELSQNELYQFKDDNNYYKMHCSNKNCEAGLDHFNSGCSVLFNEFLGCSSSFENNAKSNINIADYCNSYKEIIDKRKDLLRK